MARKHSKPPAGEKRCNRCQQVKPLNEFYKNRSEPDGYARRCKQCQKDHQRAPNCTCEVCGTSFYATPGTSSKGDGRFCSHKCFSSTRNVQAEVICLFCGRSFTAHRYEVESGAGRFCSNSCIRRYYHGEKSANWKGGGVVKRCIACGGEFSIKRYRKDSARFCSRKCHYQWIRDHPEELPMWIDGSSAGRKAYPKEWNEAFRVMIRERDNYTCVACGAFGVQVHHINYKKRDTVPENCITLCRPCHMKTNNDRVTWQIFLEGIMKERAK